MGRVKILPIIEEARKLCEQCEKEGHELGVVIPARLLTYLQSKITLNEGVWTGYLGLLCVVSIQNGKPWLAVLFAGLGWLRSRSWWKEFQRGKELKQMLKARKEEGSGG